MDHVAAMDAELGALFATDCALLDIGERRGWTSYIDFIRPDELADERAMKGTDALGRRFIVFKCTVATDPPRRLFTTFFQRYKTEASSEVTYHTAGHHGTHLFTTTGGATLAQVEHLSRLLRTGSIEMNVHDMARLRVGYREIEGLDPLTIDTVTLGWSDSVRCECAAPRHGPL